jgi:hypothetical protein
MLSIKYQGEYFDLSDGEKITVEYVSTVFNEDDEFNGSYSYPVKAPFSARNNRLLKNAHLIENRSSRIQPDVILEIFGRPWKKCKLSFDVGADGYSFYLSIDNAVFANLIKATSLHDIFTVFENSVFKNYVSLYLGHSKAETLDLLNDAIQNPGKGPCVFFPYKNDQFFGDFSGTGSKLYGDNIKIFNQYSVSFDPPDQSGDWKKNFFYTPFFYLRWLISQVCEFLGFEATGDFFTDERSLKLVIYNTGVLSYDLFLNDNGCLISVVQHLPNLKLNEFIKKLRSTYKLAIYFDANERKAYFNYAPRVLSSPEDVDISGQTEPGYEIKANTPSGFELVQQVDENDAMFGTYEYTKSFFIGDLTEPKPLTGIAGTLFSTTVLEPRPGSAATFRVPWARQLGNIYSPLGAGSPAFNDTTLAVPEIGKNDFTFRVLTYHGMQPDSAGLLYPYASGDDLDSDGTYRNGSLSCWLGGDRGMITAFQRQWLLYFLRTEQIELTAYLSADKVLQITPLKKIVWRTETQVLMSALLSQLSFEASDTYAQRLAAKITVYPDYNQAAADDPAYTQITAGTVVNPGEIYAKLRTVVTSIEYLDIRGLPKNVIVTAKHVNIFIDFFSDPAGTKARSVQNLPVKLDVHFRGAHPRDATDMQYTFSTSGSSWQVTPGLGNGQTDIIEYYKDSNHHGIVTYQLSTQPDGSLKFPEYTVIK